MRASVPILSSDRFWLPAKTCCQCWAYLGPVRLVSWSLICRWSVTAHIFFTNNVFPTSPSHMATFPQIGQFMDERQLQDECQHSALVHKISHFIYPLLIEFCVVASTMTLAIWEKCGVGMQGGDSEISTHESSTLDSDPERRISLVSSVSSSFGNVREDIVTKTGFYNSNFGFVCGWLCLMGSVVCILVVFLDLA